MFGQPGFVGAPHRQRPVARLGWDSMSFELKKSLRPGYDHDARERLAGLG